MCIGFIHSFAQFVGLRAILGLAEGGLFPGMVRSDSLRLNMFSENIVPHARNMLIFWCHYEGAIPFHHLYEIRTCFENWGIVYGHVSI